ncbi:MAG: hypothetical protein SOY60_09370 [Fusobacterium gastrosuis]|uniref:hypothetical protein n=1 Tax=Fusobacterium gastrosuis TaxID=1755100 RepID=UPI002A89CDFA|nr:hypothetical protein [Fusobacterium gastrosuis]
MEKNQIEEKKTCFIVCPISEEGSDTRTRSDKLMKYLIEPICKELNFTPIRIDKVSHNNSITEKIFKYLNEAELVISDITEHNPNCFYESGYRAALGKPLIFIKNKDVKIPFDIANTRIYDYDLDVEAADIFKKSVIENIKVLNFEIHKENQHSNKNENDGLNKVLQLLLNLDGKLDDLIKDNKISSNNIATLSQLTSLLTKNISTLPNQTRQKTQDELIFELLSKAIEDPKIFNNLIKTIEKK